MKPNLSLTHFKYCYISLFFRKQCFYIHSVFNNNNKYVYMFLIALLMYKIVKCEANIVLCSLSKCSVAHCSALHYCVNVFGPLPHLSL